MALRFDELDDYATVADHPALTIPDGDWTVGFWYRQPDNAGTGAQYALSWGDYNALPSFNVLIYEDAAGFEPNSWELRANDGAGGDTFPLSGRALNTDWQLLLVEHSQAAGASRIYVNNIAGNAHAVPLAAIDVAASLFIGTRAGAATAAAFFGGDLSNVFKFNRMLTAAQRTDLFNRVIRPRDLYQAGDLLWEFDTGGAEYGGGTAATIFGATLVPGPYPNEKVDQVKDDYTGARPANVVLSHNDPDVTVARTGGQLQITPPSGLVGSNYDGEAYTTDYDLTGVRAFWEIAGVPDPAKTADIYLDLRAADGSYFVRWYGWMTHLRAYYLAPGGATTQIGANLTRDLVAHRFLSIREAAGTVYWETSPDAVTWTQQFSLVLPAGMSVTAVRPRAIAGTYEAVTAPGTLSLEGFNTIYVAPVFTPGTATLGTVVYNRVDASATDATNGVLPYAYQWQRKPAALTTWANVVGQTTANLADTTVTAGESYNYRLRYTDASGAVVYSNELTANVPAAPPNSPPPAPGIVSPTEGEIVSGSVSVTVQSVTDPDGDAVSYRAEYSADGGVTWQVLFALQSSTMFTWNTAGLASGNYQIRAFASDGTGESGAGAIRTVSVQAVATNTAPPAPTITGPASADAFADLTIGAVLDPDGDTVHYRGEYRLAGGAWAALFGLQTGTTYRWSTAGLAAGNYEVRAFASDLELESAASAVLAITVAHAAAIPFLSYRGVEIPATELRSREGFVIGSRDRAAAGNLRSSVTGQKLEFTGLTPPMEPADALALLDVLRDPAFGSLSGDAVQGRSILCEAAAGEVPYLHGDGSTGAHLRQINFRFTEV